MFLKLACEGQAVALIGSPKSIDQKAGNRHWPDAAGNRSEGACNGGDVGMVDIANQPALAVHTGNSVDPDINHCCPGLYPVAANYLGPPDRRIDQIGLTAKVRQVSCAGMHDSHCRIFVEQELDHRTSDEV
jgi:hypothetical protein